VENCRPGGHVTGVYKLCRRVTIDRSGHLEVNWTVSRRRTFSRGGRVARAVETCFTLLS